MKISTKQRHINIITKALEKGFDFNYENSFIDICINAEDYLISDAIDTDIFEIEYCPIINGEMLWNDKMGMEMQSWGEHSTYTFAVDSLAVVYQLKHT